MDPNSAPWSFVDFDCDADEDVDDFNFLRGTIHVPPAAALFPPPVLVAGSITIPSRNPATYSQQHINTGHVCP
jgi:hypothetical protein